VNDKSAALGGLAFKCEEVTPHSIHIYIHTCIHIYMHTYIHAYIHIHIHARTREILHSDMNSSFILMENENVANVSLLLNKDFKQTRFAWLKKMTSIHTYT